MNRLFSLTAAVAIGTASLFVSASLDAQEAAEPPATASPSAGNETKPAVTTAEVQAALDALEADTSLEDAVKGPLRQKYEQALKALEAAAGFQELTEEYRTAIESGPEKAAELRTELQALGTDELPEPDVSGTAQELQNQLETQRVSLELLREQLTALTEQSSRTEGRTVQIPARMAEVQRELTTIRERLASPELTAADGGISITAEKLLLQANEAKLMAELEMLEQEQLSQSVREDMLSAQRELLARQVAAAEQTVDGLTRAVNARLSNLAERIRNAADSLPEEVLRQQADAPALKEEVLAFATEVEIAVEIGAQIKSIEEELRSGREALAAEFINVREQLELGGGGSAIVQLLFDLDRRCLRTRATYQQSKLPALEQFRIAALRVRDELREQATLESRLGAELPEQFTALVDARRQALEELDRQYSRLTRASARTEKERQKDLDQADEVRDYIAEKLFGFGLKSCPAFGLDSLGELPASLAWAFQRSHWREAANGLATVVGQTPLPTLAVFALVIGLLLARPRLVKALEQTGNRIRKISKDRYGNTTEAVLWTVLLALPLPILVGYTSWLFGQVSNPSDWLAGFRAGLQRASEIVLVTCLVMEILRSGGLGERHFGWNQAVCDRLRAAIRRIAIVYIPALVITISCTYGDASLYLQSLGRVSFMLANLWMAFLMFRLFFSPRGLPSHAVKDDEDPGILLRWRPVWLSLLCVAPLVFVVMMATGYMITAIIFSLALLATLVIIGAGILLHGFVLRWLAMKQRKLALQDAIERRRARGEEQDNEGPTEVVDVEPEEANKFDLDQVAGQTRDLLRAIFSLLVLVAVIGFWSQAFPIVDLAGSVPIPFLGGLTLLRLAAAIVIAVITFVLVKNLPGLLESVVFPSKDTVPGTRLAIYTLCQYGVTAVGVWLFLNALHVDWAQFGWAVAALSVGIGFGLQEVVANFVCGLILLFERPIRVGDIVTVESTTGTVSKIHLRATTITNWDRQEFVVPNKTLITSTLLNWTLSAPLNRVVIPVGVAYGSDTEKARQILLSVAADHSNVLDTPQPMATFEQFADSSLNIVLRVYLPDLDARLSTISELHTEINRRFAEAGIEIAFPQRDLHLRSGWFPAVDNLQSEPAEC
jgi:potassium efflux system protein